MCKSTVNARYFNYACLLIVILAPGAARMSSAQTIPPASAELEKNLIAVLQSQASYEDKAAACRQLASIGSSDAIEVLAALLGDEKLSHMARYGLETIPDAAVDDRLREALKGLQGGPLIGVIGSIGVRRDAGAVDDLAARLKHEDLAVVQAAARALGNIANAPAIQALQGELAGSTGARQLALCEGLFRGAEGLTADGRRRQAAGIYEQLLNLAAAPHQVRGGAVRGAILTRPRGGMALLREYLASEDYILFSAAVQTAQEMPGGRVTDALLAALDKLPADNQILVIQALGLRGERRSAAVAASLLPLARKGPQSVRVAAIEALPQVDDPAAAPVLIELLDDSDQAISRAALRSLGALGGPQTDGHILAMLKAGQSDRQLTAIELIGRRRIEQGVPVLLEVAGGGEGPVGLAAIKMVGELGGPGQLPALLDMLVRSQDSKKLGVVEQALKDICQKENFPPADGRKLIDRLAPAPPAAKCALLRVLGAWGGPDALGAVRAAVDDSAEQVHTTAIRVLSTWKTIDAADVLRDLAAASENDNDRTLCLRGYLNFTGYPEVNGEKRLAMCRQAAGLVRRAEEKRLLLAAAGRIQSPAALELIAPYLDDAEVRAEAAVAVVTIGEQFRKKSATAPLPAELTGALEKVVQLSDNADLTRRARQLLPKEQAKPEGR
ncbi:MAG: HEAT repeat domain-containing protein [Sedimentisphaerales bacterium]|nr:HEAT repeat domain-containing protein [Sedimentisphaerales bacterium]